MQREYLILSGGQQEFWFSKQYLTASFCQYACAFPVSQATAHRKWGHVRSFSQVVVQDSHLNAITSGNDGSCGGSYLCTAGTNQFKTYSGPAGWDTPKGIGLY